MPRAQPSTRKGKAGPHCRPKNGKYEAIPPHQQKRVAFFARGYGRNAVQIPKRVHAFRGDGAPGAPQSGFQRPATGKHEAGWCLNNLACCRESHKQDRASGPVSTILSDRWTGPAWPLGRTRGAALCPGEPGRGGAGSTSDRMAAGRVVCSHIAREFTVLRAPICQAIALCKTTMATLRCVLLP